MAAMKHVQVNIKDEELTPQAVRPGGSEKQNLDREVEEVKNLPDTVGKEKSTASEGGVKSAKQMISEMRAAANAKKQKGSVKSKDVKDIVEEAPESQAKQVSMNNEEFEALFLEGANLDSFNEAASKGNTVGSGEDFAVEVSWKVSGPSTVAGTGCGEGEEEKEEDDELFESEEDELDVTHRENEFYGEESASRMDEIKEEEEEEDAEEEKRNYVEKELRTLRAREKELNEHIARKRRECIETSGEKNFRECYEFFKSKTNVEQELQEKDIEEIHDFVYAKNIPEYEELTFQIFKLHYLECELPSIREEVARLENSA